MDSAFKDISFSSYLKPQNHTQNPTDNGTADAELSVFDAHKYFSESSNPKNIKTQKQQELPDDVLSVPRLSSVSSVDGCGKNFRTRSFRRMPTASSEASWNSRTGLLPKTPIQNSPTSLPADHRSKKSSAVTKWLLGRKCCCSGIKAVQIKEAIASEHKGAEVTINHSTNVRKSNGLCIKRDQSGKEPTSRSKSNSIALNPLPLSPDIVFGSTEEPRKQRISASGRPFLDGAISFTFPILNPSSEQSNKPGQIPTFAKPSIVLNKYSAKENPPASGPPLIADCVNSRGHLIPRSLNADDDVGSDASSDLFEIENFSTQTTSYPICAVEGNHTSAKRFNSGDGINLIEYESMSVDDEAEAEGYAPSEVSIEWNVATAEAGDRASVANFSSVSGWDEAWLKQGREEAGEKRKGNNGRKLMGCRQEKAVSVVADGGRPARGNKPPVGSCQSARLSLAFAA